MRTLSTSPPTPVSCAHHERHSTEPWLLLLFAQSWLLAALCVCCTAALRLPAALPPQCMQRPVAQQPLSTALRASAAQIRMQSADGAEGEVARRSGVSKGQLVDAISLRAGVSKKTAELVLSAGALHRELAARCRCLSSGGLAQPACTAQAACTPRHRACRARAPGLPAPRPIAKHATSPAPSECRGLRTSVSRQRWTSSSRRSRTATRSRWLTSGRSTRRSARRARGATRRPTSRCTFQVRAGLAARCWDVGGRAPPLTRAPTHRCAASTAPTFKFGKMFKAMVKDAKARD